VPSQSIRSQTKRIATWTESSRRRTLETKAHVHSMTRTRQSKNHPSHQGDFVENGFWMDAIKTHCYVTYATKDAAIKMRESLDEVKWPPESGIALSAAFSEVTAMEIMANGGDRRPNLKRKASSELQKATARTPVSIDAFFLKTETKPVLYYLPLTDEQVRQRKAQQKSGDVNGAARREKGSANLPATRKNRNKNARSNYRRVQRHGSK
uniref:Uncharacterized protein n=1 Tax=Globisporangium ultimum (strain ATCC 200006 / CBS 805.95 / DAOM BR144) TaxID=431595 RepID=K3WEJ1_GLOUD